MIFGHCILQFFTCIANNKTFNLIFVRYQKIPSDMVNLIRLLVLDLVGFDTKRFEQKMWTFLKNLIPKTRDPKLSGSNGIRS